MTNYIKCTTLWTKCFLLMCSHFTHLIEPKHSCVSMKKQGIWGLPSQPPSSHQGVKRWHEWQGWWINPCLPSQKPSYAKKFIDQMALGEFESLKFSAEALKAVKGVFHPMDNPGWAKSRGIHCSQYTPPHLTPCSSCYHKWHTILQPCIHEKAIHERTIHERTWKNAPKPSIES